MTKIFEFYNKANIGTHFMFDNKYEMIQCIQFTILRNSDFVFSPQIKKISNCINANCKRNSFFGIDILFNVNKYTSTFSVGDSTERTNKVRWCSNMGVVSCSIVVVLYVTDCKLQY